MNCLSINIRGIGIDGKSRWIKRLKNEFGISFIGMQETMASNLHSGLMTNFWGGMGYDCEIVDANGHSGGIVSCWDPKIYVKDYVLKDNNFLHVSGLLVDGLVRLNIINVYAPQQNVEKRILWEKILRVKQARQGWWIIFGEFNAVRDSSERKNSNFDPVCARDFNDFIDEAGLQEYNLKGMKYTYLTNRGGDCKMSRIDRILVCSNVFNKWPNAYVRALKRELSDHSPIETNFGSKPFRWFDSWFERQGCEDLVISVLRENIVQGPSDVGLSMKLKCLRDRLKIWHKSWKSKEMEDEVRLRSENEELETLME
ncbi:uncharacterized protein LOC110934221 [Helianthus annuus]|uniref:uncharacterized protein LOC110934221 n=1 Tax=Helianthus annuus TaxID=4232 RepID=UPI000B8F88C4|nr:uncharacterized protein LOC110934221 [Helianthus annuus]